jgi:uncharacterized membrane protein YphA (DoxX/SURF4 family)
LAPSFYQKAFKSFYLQRSWDQEGLPKSGYPNSEFLGPFVGSFGIACGFLMLIGLCTRLAAVPLITIMLVAIATTKADVLANDGFWKMMHGSRTVWAMLLGSCFLLIKGGGRWSVDYAIYNGTALNLK